ncbi:MAG: hypothetical protein N2Z62_08520 [Rhodobacteraceae bacterium]|nr:hypothetical protein [Paracoccaceae bacterium]
MPAPPGSRSRRLRRSPPASRALRGVCGGGQDAGGEIGLPDAGDRIVLPIDHFSGAGVSIADRINLQLDRWRQRFLEDRVRAQLAEAARRHMATGDATALTEALGRDMQRIVAHGWRNLAARPGATCADVAEAARGLAGIASSVSLMGIETDIDMRQELRLIFGRYRTACFPEEVQTCLRTGDLRGLLRFAASPERPRPLSGLSAAAG